MAGLLLGLLLAGCYQRPKGPFRIHADGCPVSIVAHPAADGSPWRFELNLSQGSRTWSVRTFTRALASSRRPDRAQIEAALRGLLAWREPYLFVREDNGKDDGWRANVDHVFRVTGDQIERMGALSAMSGPPGSQWRDGRFYDVYDRLEFTFLTSRREAPQFELVLEEFEGRFAVRTDETWTRGKSRYDEKLQFLRRAAEHPEQLAREIDRRAARAAALHCLAFSRYCGRGEEYEESLALARRVSGSDLPALVEEAATVLPGELAPSRDEVLRANPALVNLFKESPEALTDREALHRKTGQTAVPVGPGAIP
jgi:hypothetical protein